MNSPLELRKSRLRGLLPPVRSAATGDWSELPAGSTGCGRAGAWDVAHGRAAESAQADFVKF
jgi:hypothetical protein